MSLTEYYSFRQDLIDTLIRDLIGPSTDDEIIDDAPLTRYASGILYPQQSGTLEASEDIDETEDTDKEVVTDPPVALANVKYPSSMGMTFAVDSVVSPTITVHVSAARYVPLEEDTESDTSTSVKLRRAGKRERWKREALEIAPIDLDITKPEAGFSQQLLEGQDLYLFYRIRPSDAFGSTPVTLVLVNNTIQPEGPGKRDVLAYFQPEIVVTAGKPGRTAFVERVATRVNATDDDLRAYRLLYRHAREFAMGHGCSVRWQEATGDPSRASLISTTFAPQYEVPLSDSNPNIKSEAMAMQYLVEADRTAVITELEKLCDGYADWIDAKQVEAENLDGTLQGTAQTHLKVCRDAVRRMRAGVATISGDDKAWEAFRLMNQAMLAQRARTVWLRNGRPTDGPQESGIHKWRPFQLAFILLCLEGIANPKSEDRNFADLLWFPTGGGKTEAYLGLIAFTVFLRRLSKKDGGGVTALMRYTLRLLTIQQFERATLLICCCEAIRRVRTDLGREPISIGLWVGQGATPNTLEEARAALNKLRSGGMLEESNPCQIAACPWCGTTLDHTNYYIKSDKSALVVACRRKDCDYKDGLPVYVVDEDVYSYRPTLIIATADKFAGLPWRDQSAELFNLKTLKRSEQLRPELIIQDELHLISGPLGTLAGLYETAVDLLCTEDGIRPKIIASTATIRRAGKQAQGLFNRKVQQFPPPALDARDSYFAVESPREERGTRKYIGLMAPGTSHTTLLVRAYASLLQNATDIPAPDHIRDPYWTLVGYFNSLRVLGGALMQVHDDVNDRIELLANQTGKDKRPIETVVELTSREASSAIPQRLKDMAVSLGSSETPLDVILATNMISVGVDIDRLGLMAVMGQPQSTSEYIQSTSRVGRTYPGLVVVLFNSAKSRDRSHYESFVAYHSALYRQVESTSVTPFSSRSRDRGLHAVLVALARLLVPEFRPNSKADLIATQRDRLDVVKNAILDRVKEVSPEETEATAQQLEELLDAWMERAVDGGTLVYNDPRNSAKSLLVVADGTEQEDRFATLWSLRDVDRESTLYLLPSLKQG